MNSFTRIEFEDLKNILFEVAKRTADQAADHCVHVRNTQGDLIQTTYVQDLGYIGAEALEKLRQLVPDVDARGPLMWAVHEVMDWIAVQVQERILLVGEPLFGFTTWTPSKQARLTSMYAVAAERALVLRSELEEIGVVVDDELGRAA